MTPNAGKVCDISLTKSTKSHVGGLEQKCVRCLSPRPITARTDTKTSKNVSKKYEFTEFICHSFTLHAEVERLINPSTMTDLGARPWNRSFPDPTISYLWWIQQHTATIKMTCTRASPFGFPWGRNHQSAPKNRAFFQGFAWLGTGAWTHQRRLQARSLRKKGHLWGIAH